MELDEKVIEEKAKELQRAYRRAKQKEWRKNNPDKIKAAKERYWRKKALAALEAEQNAE